MVSFSFGSGEDLNPGRPEGRPGFFGNERDYAQSVSGALFPTGKGRTESQLFRVTSLLQRLKFVTRSNREGTKVPQSEVDWNSQTKSYARPLIKALPSPAFRLKARLDFVRDQLDRYLHRGCRPCRATCIAEMSKYRNADTFPPLPVQH